MTESARAAALCEALTSQVEIVRGIRPERLSEPSACEGWTARDVLNHSLGVSSKFASFALGHTDSPRPPKGDILRADPIGVAEAIARYAVLAWSAVDLDSVCRLSFGTFTAHEVAGINLFDVLAHTWDIACLSAVPLDETSPAWTLALDAAHELLAAGRDPQHYGPELIPAADATPMRRLLCFLGRGDGQRSPSA